MKSLQKGIVFLENIKGSVGILHDSDCDGTCSAAIILAYLNSKKIKAELHQGDYSEEVFEEFSKIKFDNYIFLDLGLSQNFELLKFFKEKKVLIIDHHIIEKDLNKMGFVFVNPRLENPDFYTSTTHLAYDICKSLGLKNFEWLMRIGDVGDSVIKGNEEEKQAAEIIEAVKIIKGQDLSKISRFLSTCKRIEDFVYRGDYRSVLDTLRKELNRTIDKIEAEGLEEINFIEVKAGYKIIRIVSNELFDKHPDKTIILYQKTGNGWSVSGRSHKYNLGELFKKAAEGIGRGGGHTVAAGAKINDIKKFKKRFLELAEHK